MKKETKNVSGYAHNYNTMYLKNIIRVFGLIYVLFSWYWKCMIRYKILLI